jgi:hypothetical protein
MAGVVEGREVEPDAGEEAVGRRVIFATWALSN